MTWERDGNNGDEEKGLIGELKKKRFLWADDEQRASDGRRDSLEEGNIDRRGLTSAKKRARHGGEDGEPTRTSVRYNSTHQKPTSFIS